MFSKVLRQIELWDHELQTTKAKARFQPPPQPQPPQPDMNLPAPLAAAATEEQRDAKRPRFTVPPAIHMGFASGSVDGVVGRMAEPQNLGKGRGM